jgi:vacuolar-type H+-ATPase subunit F/Vma7
VADTGKAAAIGEPDFVMPFQALGLDTFSVQLDPDQVAQTAQKIVNEKYSFVVIAENMAPMAEETFSPTADRPTPCVVVVPFTTEPEGFAIEALGKTLKMATGIDILKNY